MLEELESRIKQAKALLEEAEIMKKEVAEQKLNALRRRAEKLKRLAAQAVEDSLGGGETNSQPRPRGHQQHSQQPPKFGNRADSGLEPSTGRSRQASPSVKPLPKTKRPISPATSGTIESTSGHGRSKKAKLRGGGSEYYVLEWHRPARPKTIWGGPAWP